MSNINKAAVLIPFSDLTAKEHSDRLTAIEAQVASTLATQKSEVATAIAQVNLTQSQTITALTLEVSNLKTNLTASITATQTDLINRADQLAQEVTDTTVQLTQDKAAFTQEIQDALDYLKDDASVASALRTPRKIQGVDFDGTQDINLPIFSTQTDGLVPKPEGSTTTNYLCEDGTWAVPPDTTYALLTKASAEDGTATTANTISAQVLKEAIQYHASTVTDIVGNAGTATKLQTPRTINGVSFDGTQNILLPPSEDYSLPVASASELGGIKVGSGLAIANSVLSVGTLNQSTTGNAATATQLQTARTIFLTGEVTGSVNFDGSANASITTTITGLGVANGIATLDYNGQVPSTQLPSYVGDVLNFPDLASFPVVGEDGKIYIAEDVNKTYRWGGSSYVEIGGGGVALGETSSTAYRGDNGKIAYAHALSQGNPHNTTTTDINEGTKLFFTESRVNQTVLTGLNTSTATPALATDQLLAAIGKLQAQINNIGGGSVTWVNAASIGTIHPAFTTVQFAKIDGLLWIRGYCRYLASIPVGTTLFLLTDPSYHLDIPTTSTSPSRMGEIRVFSWDVGAAKIIQLKNVVNNANKFALLNSTNFNANEYNQIQPVALGSLLTP